MRLEANAERHLKSSGEISRLYPGYQDAIGRTRRSFPWLEVDRKTLRGKFLDYPEREDIPENIREQLIVELYSK